MIYVKCLCTISIITLTKYPFVADTMSIYPQVLLQSLLLRQAPVFCCSSNQSSFADLKFGVCSWLEQLQVDCLKNYRVYKSKFVCLFFKFPALDSDFFARHRPILLMLLNITIRIITYSNYLVALIANQSIISDAFCITK